MNRPYTALVILLSTFARWNQANDVLNIGCLLHNSTGGIEYLQDITKMAVERNKHIVEQHGYTVNYLFRDSGCDVSQGGSPFFHFHHFCPPIE